VETLACADAVDKKLADARTRLQQAIAHKANVISGETMPDPTNDDSFLPYRDNNEFWAFFGERAIQVGNTYLLNTLCNLSASTSSDVVGSAASSLGNATFKRAGEFRV
jgi:hypothetical protein